MESREQFRDLRILFLGENWYGSCARACCSALRRLGCVVVDVDSQTILPQWRSKGLRAALRLGEKVLIREYNDRVVDVATRYRPDILIAFKGHYLLASTLSYLKRQRVCLYNYYPDASVYAYGGILPTALPEYDCLFLTKPFLEMHIRQHIAIRQTFFLPHGYDPELHYPRRMSDADLAAYGSGVAFIGTHTTHKEAVLDALLNCRPALDLGIWGDGWTERCAAPRVRARVRGSGIHGADYAIAVGAAGIQLAIMSGQMPGWPHCDETTTRTYEIPACGGFMLHERTPEVVTLFEEGREIECFASAEELASKIDYYLDHHELRVQLAAAAHARCVPAYSYDSRMVELLRWHCDHTRSKTTRSTV